MTVYQTSRAHLKVMMSNFRRLMRPFDYRFLVVALVVAVGLWIIMANDLIRPAKEPLEIAAVVLSAALMLIAAARFIITRHVFFLWSTVLFLLIMCREIHFAGTDEAIFIGFAILFGVILSKYDLFSAYLDNPWVVNLLIAGFFTYFLSQTVDQRWWRFVPGEDLAHVPMEESLELLGHLIIGFAAVLCKGCKQDGKGLPMPTG